MLITVIIPVWNDEKRISLCLDALHKQSIGVDSFEVIVVDNASTDGTSEALKAYPWITVLYEPEPGSYGARNRAINDASGEYLAFTDSDCIPAQTWLEACLACAQKHPGFGVVAGDVTFFEATEASVEQSAIDFETMFSMDQKINSQNGVSITANFFVQRKTVHHFGGFNQKLKSGGDHELSKRIYDSGRAVIFCQEGYVAHPARNINELLIKRRRVIGGSWDRQQTRAKPILFAWQATKLIVKRTLQVIFTTKIRLNRKPALLWLLCRIYGTSLAEITRLFVGGTSTRS